jgi:hypothetical protein
MTELNQFQLYTVPDGAMKVDVFFKDDSVISMLETNAANGKNNPSRYFNLDVIIAFGYRLSRFQVTLLHTWATTTLRAFITKGFVLDDRCLKRGKQTLGEAYYDERLKRIRQFWICELHMKNTRSKLETAL